MPSDATPYLESASLKLGNQREATQSVSWFLLIPLPGKRPLVAIGHHLKSSGMVTRGYSALP